MALPSARQVVEYQLLAPDMAAQFPGLFVWEHGVEEPTVTISFNHISSSFYGMISSANRYVLDIYNS